MRHEAERENCLLAATQAAISESTGSVFLSTTAAAAGDVRLRLYTVSEGEREREREKSKMRSTLSPNSLSHWVE